MESLVMSKKYVVPLAVVSPWVAGGGAVAYVAGGRFNPEKHVFAVLGPVELNEYLSAFSEYARDESPVTVEPEAAVADH